MGLHTSRKLNIHGNVQLIYLPAYSQELNPIETFWKWLRKKMFYNVIYKSLSDLTDALQNASNSIL